MYATMAPQKSIYEMNQINSTMNDFHQSKVWVSSRLLMMQIYRATEGFPDKDDSLFKNQTRNFSVLITGNVIRGLQETNASLRSRFLKDAESFVEKLTDNLETAYKKGYLQKSMNRDLIKEISEIQKSLKAIQH